MEDLDLSYLQHCDNRSSTDPIGAPNVQPIDPKIINRPPGTSDETWNAFLRTMHKNGTPVGVIEAAEEKRKANPMPEWMKEPEHNPAIEPPAAGELYTIRLNPERFENDTEAARAASAVQDQYRRLGLPAVIADGFTQTLEATNKALASLEGEERRAAYLEREQATLVRTYGPERAQTMLDKADRMAKQLGQSAGFVEAVGGPDAFHSASSIVAASNAYDLLQYRKGK